MNKYKTIDEEVIIGVDYVIKEKESKWKEVLAGILFIGIVIEVVLITHGLGLW